MGRRKKKNEKKTPRLSGCFISNLSQFRLGLVTILNSGWSSQSRSKVHRVDRMISYELPLGLKEVFHDVKIV